MHLKPETAHEWVVLIVDDALDNLLVASAVFRRFNVDVHTAANGQAALEQLKRITPTFILLDLAMPDMDGWTLFETIRQKPEYQHIPIIALTAHDMPDDMLRAQRCGFDGFITKPFAPRTLLQDICKAINGA